MRIISLEVRGALDCSAILPSRSSLPFTNSTFEVFREQGPRVPFHPTTLRAPRPRPRPRPPRGGRPGPRRGLFSSVTNCSLTFPPAPASSSSSRLARFPNRKPLLALAPASFPTVVARGIRTRALPLPKPTLSRSASVSSGTARCTTSFHSRVVGSTSPSLYFTPCVRDSGSKEKTVPTKQTRSFAQ